MKLHLPVILRQSVLACLTTVSAMTLNCGSAWADSVNEPQNLVFNGASLIWNTDAGNQSFTNEDGEASAFAAGDNVRFESDSSVVLGGNITAGQVSIAGGADVVIERESYVLDFDTLALQGGSLQIGESLSLGAGDALAVGSNGAVLKSALLLGEEAKLSVDFSGRGAATSLNGSTLSLQGGSQLQLSGCGNGDGKTYVLFTDVSSLKDADGNTIALNSTNNAISHYFDTSKPGTGFWAGSTLQLSADGALQLVRHNEETKAAVKISERQTGNVDYQYYAGVAFENISDTTGSDGGAIAVYGGNLEMSDNGSVKFSGNSASDDGGAIYVIDNLEMSDNGSVKFSGNSASDEGGALCGYGVSSTIELNSNGSVEFSSNTADDGGAIAVNCDLEISNNNSVEFSSNTATGTSSDGGAIYVTGNLEMYDNSSVDFSGNSAYDGGAISGSGSMKLSSNGSVEFSSNTASFYGGAIHAISSNLEMSDNSSVKFRRNSASYRGGALSVYGSMIKLSSNGSVEFSGNSSYSIGGAIALSNGNLEMSDNDSVKFSSNTADDGGAIYVYGGNLEMSDNGSVKFSGNSASDNGGALWGGTVP